mgnify:CR=1 FL=1
MKLADWVIFGGLALGAHVAVIVWTNPPQGADAGSGGTQGADSVSVTAATPQIATMVAKWTQTPQITEDMRPLHQPHQPQPDTSIDRMSLDRPTDPPVAPQRPAPLVGAARDTSPQAPEPMTQAPILPSDIAASPIPSVPTKSDLAPRVQPAARTPDVQVPKPPRQNTVTLPPATPPQLDTATADPIVPPAPQSIPGTRPKPRPASAPQIAQTAKGSGNTSQASISTKPKSATASGSNAQQKSDLATWKTQIRNAIERKKFYPKRTRARGRVVIRVSVSQNGDLLKASVDVSSGFGVIDRAALAAVQRARFPQAPESLQDPQYIFRIPIKMGPN